MIGNAIKIVILAGVLSSAISPQFVDFPKPPEVLYAQSWRCLGSVLPKTEYDLRLEMHQEKFSKVLIADNGRKFRLSVERDNSKWLSLPRWSVHMIDQTSPKAIRGELISEREDQVSYLGYIYPRLKPIVVDGKNLPLWGDGEGYPFVMTERNIRVDDFVVTIKVTDIKWKDHEGGKVAYIDVILKIEPWRDRTDKGEFPTQNCFPAYYQK